MDDVLSLLTLITLGTVLALLIGQFGKSNPNAPTGFFGRLNGTWSWAIKNAFGG